TRVREVRRVRGVRPKVRGARGAMSVRHTLTIAIVALASGSMLLAQGGRARPAVRPQPAPTIDVAAVLKDTANALGMLRQANRIDPINTMEFWGTGTSN